MDLKRLFRYLKWSPSDAFSAWRIKCRSNPLAAREKENFLRLRNKTNKQNPEEMKMMAKLNNSF